MLWGAEVPFAASNMSWISSALVVSPGLGCDAIMKEVVTAEKRPACEIAFGWFANCSEKGNARK